MKALLILCFAIFSLDAFAQGDLSGKLRGQRQSTSNLFGTLQVPNNQSTKTGAVSALIETGNANLLANPGFEHSLYTTSWTTSGTATYSAETVAPLAGLKSFKAVASAQTIDVFQDTTLYAGVLAGTQGVIRFKASNTAAGVTVCVRAAGVKLSGAGNCITLATDGLKKNYELPVVLSATSNGVEVDSASTTGTLILDDFEVSDDIAFPEVAQAQIAGESYFAGTSSCTWTRTNTAVGAFASTAACPGPTIVEQNLGIWLTTDSDLPRQSVNSLPAGKYKATFIFPNFAGASANTAYAINDGTTTCEAVVGTTGTVSIGSVVSCVFTYTAQGDRVFEIYGAASTSSANIINTANANPRASTKFILEYYPPASKIYSQGQEDSNWESCGLVAGDFTGFGTPSGINLNCKKDGPDLLVRGTFVSGTSTATEARVALKFRGQSLTSQDSSSIPLLQSAGTYFVSVSSNSKGGTVLAEPSVGYFTLSTSETIGTPVVVALAKANGNVVASSGTTVSVLARVPIQGWSTSMITGSFVDEVKSSGSGTGVDLQVVHFGSGANCTSACTTGTCTICPTQIGDKITSVTFQSTGTYRLNGIDGLTKYSCSGSGVTTQYTAIPHDKSASTTTYATVNSAAGGSLANVGSATVICVGKP